MFENNEGIFNAPGADSGFSGKITKYALILALCWTIFNGFILYSARTSLTNKAIELARQEADHHFDWMVSFRSWVAKFGGVYAPVSDRLQPNQYLHVPNRDISTIDGKLFTLINPAYMSRLVFAEYGPKMHMKGNLTSLNPINPNNAPDEWETEALVEFNDGGREKSEITNIFGDLYFRLIRPLLVEKACLKCHAFQGYIEGDVRGGMSISVPMQPLYERSDIEFANISFVILAFWVIGISGIVFVSIRLKKAAVHQEKSDRKSALLATAVEHAAEEIIITDTNGVILYMNPSMEKNTGYTLAEAEGESPKMFGSGRHSEDYFREMWGRLESGNIWEGKFINKRKDGRIYTAKATISPVKNETGTNTGYVGVERDISKEDILLKSKEYFSAATSHELRTPLTKLQLLKILIEDLPSSEVGTKCIAVVNEIYGEIDRLLSATTTLSETSAIASKTSKPVEIVPLLRHCIEAVKTNALREKRNVRIFFEGGNVDDHDSVFGQEIVFIKLFDELLSNAVKYSPNGKDVLVTCSRADYKINISMKDNGIGIDMENAESLFDPFYSAEKVTEHSSGRYKFCGGGIGLGLSISRMIVEAFGGSISIKSEGSNRGSEVTLSFPLIDLTDQQ